MMAVRVSNLRARRVGLYLCVACCRALASYTPNASQLRQSNYAGDSNMWCVGMNAVGFDLDARGGRNGGWTAPSKEAIRYFHNKGSNCFRLPITWERMQNKLGTTDLSLVSQYAEIVDFITVELGDYAIIDPHNNDQGLTFNGLDAKRSDFVSLWVAISRKWRTNPRAIFGLYNEPRYGHEDGRDGYFDPDATDESGTMIEYWRQWMQETIDAIRGVGARNLILVPGLHWTTCRDWSGASWWGESLDVYAHAGNTRLAALTDTAMNIAYDVHQYMDDSFTGVARGCGGHEAFGKYSPGADAGLELTIQWAKTYNKKLMMTEIGSWDAKDGTGGACKAKMSNYVQMMNNSGVFLGYQVWQFGCESCEADLWSQRPLNFYWYRLSEFGAPPGQGTTTTITTVTTTSTTNSTTETTTITTEASSSSRTPLSTSTTLMPATITTTEFISSSPKITYTAGNVPVLLFGWAFMHYSY